MALFAIAGLLAVACSNDDGTGSTVATTAPAVSEAPTTTATVADTVADTTAATKNNDKKEEDPNAILPAKEGLNRFIWDMRYPEATKVPGDLTTENSIAATGPRASRPSVRAFILSQDDSRPASGRIAFRL